MSGLVKSRIPYFAAVDAVRWNVIEGCSNTADICAVRGLGLCWAEKMRRQSLCTECGCECTYGDEDCTWRQENPAPCFHNAFVPEFHESVLQAPLHARKPKVIAVGFGGDIFSEGVEQEWLDKIWQTVRECEGKNLLHTWIFLTKRPDRIIVKAPINHNTRYMTKYMWFGASVTKETEIGKIYDLDNRAYLFNTWVSFEPVLSSFEAERTGFYLETAAVDFIVIGGLSDGNGRPIPPDQGGTQASWVQPILDAAAEAGCKIFCKNLSQIYRELVNPRTGKPMKSATELREIPDEWRL